VIAATPAREDGDDRDRDRHRERERAGAGEREDRMISSVAYADDEMLSDAKTARPLKIPTRSWISRSLGIGRPTRTRRTRFQTTPLPVDACSVATRRPLLRVNRPRYVGTIRTTRSPGSAPWRTVTS
jgi:hypothetical protein